MIDIVITMAGLGSRFKKAGYKDPKYMINAHGKSLFEWSLISLNNYKHEADNYFFIVRKEDRATNFITNICNKLGIYNIHIIEIDYLTAGQAASCYLAKDLWNKDNGLIIYNIDTYIEPQALLLKDIKGDGFIPCFKETGDHWSFVKTDHNMKALMIKEKERISDNCSIGLYYFSSCRLYEQIYEECYINNKIDKTKNEEYIAPMYNYMLILNKNIYISIVDNALVHVLGTPEELDIFLQQNIK